MNINMDYWKRFEGEDTFYNIVEAKPTIFEEYAGKVSGLQEEISLRVSSYITRIPYDTLKNKQIKINKLKCEVIIESHPRSAFKLYKWIYNGEVLAEMIPDISEITYSIQPFIYWENDK